MPTARSGLRSTGCATGPASSTAVQLSSHPPAANASIADMDRSRVAAAALTSALGLSVPGVSQPEGRWAWPVGDGSRPAVVAPFDAPDSRWGAGHRGIDLGSRVGEPVRAVADGTITHRGRVAGRPTITVTHEDGIRSTYEPVASDLGRGDRVSRGETIGRVSDEPGHCAPGTCLHLGALQGPDYLDPLPFFGARRVVLLPVP